MKALLFLNGIALLVYATFFASPERMPVLTMLAGALIGLPLVTQAPSREELEAKDHLTPLDKAWLGYHRYLSGPDA